MGLLVLGFSVLTAASGLVVANSELAVLFNTPPPGYPTNLITGFPFQYSVAERVQAGAVFVEAIAAAVAAAGGAAMLVWATWGASVAAFALGTEAMAQATIMIVAQRGVLLIPAALTVLWTLTLIVLVAGFRPAIPRVSRSSSTRGSRLEDNVPGPEEPELGS